MRRFFVALPLSAALLSSACAVSVVDGAENRADQSTASAPLIGVDGAGDFADRSCQIVLRDFANTGAVNGSRFIFEGRVDVKQTAIAEGAVPHLLVKAGSDAGWRALDAVASVGMPDGVERFLFRLEDGDLPGPGHSATALARTTIELVPFLGLDGARLFDHNRIVDALGTYVVNQSSGFAVAEDSAICAGPSGPTITFDEDFDTDVSAPIVAGRSVTIDYAISRLPNCRARYAGRPAWSTFGVARFLPMNVVQQFVVVDHTVDPSASKPATLQVPAGATELVLYFQNNDRGGCNEYDSDYATNYHFAVVDEAPQWLGNVASVTSRSASSRCEGAVAVTGNVGYDSWTRQRAVVTDLCFEVYEPGVTDFDNGDLWQQLDVQAHHRFDPAAGFATSYVSFAHRVGNNAQYALDLRTLDPFAWGRCSNHLPLTTTSVGGEAHVQATLEVYFTVNGTELRPAAGQTYKVVFDDAANGARVTCD